MSKITDRFRLATKMLRSVDQKSMADRIFTLDNFGILFFSMFAIASYLTVEYRQANSVNEVVTRPPMQQTSSQYVRSSHK